MSIGQLSLSFSAQSRAKDKQWQQGGERKQFGAVCDAEGEDAAAQLVELRVGAVSGAQGGQFDRERAVPQNVRPSMEILVQDDRLSKVYGPV